MSKCPVSPVETSRVPLSAPANHALQLLIIRTDVLIVTVLHAEAPRDRTELSKAQPFIEMPRVDIALHDGVELQDPKAQLSALLQAVQHQPLADVETARRRRRRSWRC